MKVRSADSTFKKVSLRDVATEAGVSPSTVSRILNRTPGFTVTEEIRLRVLDTAKRLGYVPRLSLRNALKQFEGTLSKTGRRRTNNIALVFNKEMLADTTARFDPGSMMRDLAFKAQQLGFNLLITGISNELILPQPVLEEKVDAVILASEMSQSFVHAVKVHVPVITSGFLMPDTGIPGARVNHSRAFRIAFEHLLGLNHTRIAICARSLDPPPHGDRRYQSIINHAREFGINIIPEWTQPFHCIRDDTILQTDKLVEAYIASENKPSAIVATDYEAFCLYHAFRASGVKIPENLSMVVVGNEDWCALCNMRMTSVPDPKKEMAQWVIEEAIRLVESDERPIHRLELSGTTKEGDSTAYYQI